MITDRSQTHPHSRLQAALMMGIVMIIMTISAPARAETQVLDSVVAIVEDDVVVTSELRERLQGLRSALAASDRVPPPEEVLVRDTLDQLILESIQLQRGKRAGVHINDEQLNSALSRIAAQQDLNLEQLRTQLEAQGGSYQAMRDEVRRKLIIQRVQQGSVNQRIQLSEQEIDNYLESEGGRDLMAEEYRLIHALLPVTTDTTPEQAEAIEAHVNAVHERIIDGTAFDKAIIDSEDHTFEGGDLGWRKQDDLPSLFADIALELEPGQTSKPIRSPSGFHLIYLADKRGGSVIVEQTHVRHILLEPSAVSTDEETEQLAQQLREQVLDGEDFGELAREHSKDIGSAAEGGDLDWVNPRQMVPEFEEVMNATDIDAVSQPFRSQFGWHILQVLGRREQDVSDTVMRNRAGEILHQRKYQEELDAWLRKIRDEAFVDIK